MLIEVSQNNSCCDGATTASAGDDAAIEIPSKVSKSSGKSSYLYSIQASSF